MSTTPSSIATEATTVITEMTGVTEATSGFDSIKQIMDEFDPAALLPELNSVTELVSSIAGVAVVIGPVILLVLGLAYLFLAPKEANYRFGYRCYHGMGSVEAWRYTQRMAGLIWAVLGAALTAVSCFAAVGYGGKDVMAVMDSAITLLIWELVLAVISCVAINALVICHFDRNGNRRQRNAE